MKIILFSPAWSGTHGRYKKLMKVHGENPPMGLVYLAGAAVAAGAEVKIIDAEIQNYTHNSLADEINSYGADLVGISATTPMFCVAVEYAKKIKQDTRALTIIGGAHITALKQDAFDAAFDFGVVGEAEKTLIELIGAIEKKRDFSSVNGLLYRQDGLVKINAPRGVTENLAEFGLPKREFLLNERYSVTVPGKGRTIATGIIASRGCPFHCTFCSAPNSYGGKVRFRDPADIVDEMSQVLERFGISHFRFYDSTLTLNRRQIDGLCEEIIARKIKVTWEGWTRASLIDRQLIRLMKRSGFCRISFGVESANASILKNIKKEVSKEDVRAAIDMSAEEGLEVTCSLMIGNPGETRQTIIETIKFARSLNNIPYMPLSIATPYPGTEFYSMAKNGEFGLKLLTEDYSRYLRYDDAVIEVNGLGPRELLRLQRWGLLYIHSRPFRVWYLLRKMGIKFIFYVAVFFLGFGQRKK